MKNTIHFEKPEGLVDFLYTVTPEEEVSIRAVIKRCKEKHNSLCESYYTFVNSGFLHPHLVFLSKDYEKLLFYVNELIFLNRNTSFRSALISVSNILEETALAIWSNEIVKKENDQFLYRKNQEYLSQKYGTRTDTGIDNFDEDDFEEEY